MTRRRKESISACTRKIVFERDGRKCRYCGSEKGPFALDHVYPESLGGKTTSENLVVSCRRCNTNKSAKVGIWPKPSGYFYILEIAKIKIDKIFQDIPNWIYILMVIGAAIVVLSELSKDPIAHAMIALVGYLFLFSGICSASAWIERG